jgi:hypothetical protein
MIGYETGDGEGVQFFKPERGGEGRVSANFSNSQPSIRTLAETLPSPPLSSPLHPGNYFIQK